MEAVETEVITVQIKIRNKDTQYAEIEKVLGSDDKSNNTCTICIHIDFFTVFIYKTQILMLWQGNDHVVLIALVMIHVSAGENHYSGRRPCRPDP
ncbi:MAG TPA: hypothetical protein PKV75_07955 [Desulfobacterales bacterium]|nr:hypothetical protein [Desulfobacterales bacterium]